MAAFCHFYRLPNINILSKWLPLGWLLLTLNVKKTPLGQTGHLKDFLGSFSMPPALDPRFPDLRKSTPALSSTLATFGCLFFLTVQTTPITVSEAILGSLPLAVQHLCDLWDAMPRHWSPAALPRGLRI